MSKNLSLDIKTIYQIGLGLVGVASGILILINILTISQIVVEPKVSPTLNIREQQLKQALQLTGQKPLEN